MPHELGGPGTMGVADLLLGTGPVVQVVLWTLVLFSVVSWGIIIYKLNQISHARRESERFIALFWESKNLAAIPAQMLYNYFTARVRELAIEMENFTSEFLNIAERHFLS